MLLSKFCIQITEIKLTLLHHICLCPLSENCKVVPGSQKWHPSTWLQARNWRLPQHTRSDKKKDDRLIRLIIYSFIFFSQIQVNSIKWGGGGGGVVKGMCPIKENVTRLCVFLWNYLRGSILHDTSVFMELDAAIAIIFLV